LNGSAHTRARKNTETSVVDSKEIGPEVDANKLSRDQNAGASHNIKTHNSFFEGVE